MNTTETSLREWVAEFALVGLGLALAFSTARLFADVQAVQRMMLVAVAAWAVAMVTRRLPLQDPARALVFLGFGVWAILFATVPDTFSYGFPTASSFTEAADLVRTDIAVLRTEVAPVESRGGHLVLLGTLIWAAAGYLSSAAMTLRLTLWAPVPHITAVVVIGLLSRDEARLATSAALLAAIAAYFVTQLEWKAERLPWIRPVPRLPRGAVGDPPRSGGTARVAILGIAAIVGIGGQALYFSDPDPTINYRKGDGDNTTNVVSPFVEVGSYLNGAGRDSLLFTARTSSPAYWRLTALDEYDADSGAWILSNSYDPTDGQLKDPSASDQRMEVAVASMGGQWVPGPNDPVSVSSEVALGWDASAGSLFAMGGGLAADDAFGFAGANLPEPDQVGGPAGRAEAVLLDTSGLSQASADFVGSMWAELGVDAAGGEGLTSPYQSALAAQNWMRTNFTYDESIDLRGSTDPLADFIAAGRGFCQQFSTLFALSMRAIGVPSRVVVGFTPGEPIAEDATTDEATTEETGNGDVELAVHGRQAHAWPEILVEGAGWVPLEPTPGRGDPAAAALTGVPPGQTVGEDRSAAAPTTAAPTTTNPVATTTTVPEGSPDEPTQVTAAGEPGGSGPNLWIASAALIGALAATIFVIWNRLRRRDRPVHGTDREDSVIARAWQDVCRELASRGIAAADSETPNEFARRAEPAMQALVQLADLETRRRWARDSPSGHDETVATELGNQLVLTLEANPPTESAQR